MTRIQLTEDAPKRVNAGGTLFKRGIARDVDDERAEQLVDGPHFEYADETAPDTSADDADSDEFDVHAWLDQDYGDRVDRVEAGEVDDQLDAIADAETSDTVLDAIGMRRAELEE